MSVESTVPERVQKGIDWLYKNVDGWLDKIDEKKFDFIRNCALTQATGLVFGDALRRYVLIDVNAAELGFMFCSAEHNDGTLELEWKKRIKELKATTSPQFDKWIKASDDSYYNFDNKGWLKHNEFGETDKYISVFEIYSILSHGGTFIKEPTFKERVKYPLIFVNPNGMMVCFGEKDIYYVLNNIRSFPSHPKIAKDSHTISELKQKYEYVSFKDKERLELLKIFERAVNEAKKNGEL